MRHSTPSCSTWMAISYPKLVKVLQKSWISDNLTDKIETQTIVPTQSHRVSWGPGVFDANLPADVCVISLSVALENWDILSQNRCPLIRCLPYPGIASSYTHITIIVRMAHYCLLVFQFLPSFALKDQNTIKIRNWGIWHEALDPLLDLNGHILPKISKNTAKEPDFR